MEKITRLGYEVVDGIASGSVTPIFVHKLSWLGASVHVDERAVADVPLISDVDPQGRGYEAGLRNGDFITKIGDEVVTDAAAVGPALAKIDPGTRLALTVSRGGDVVTIAVERAKTGYLGIRPGPLRDETRKKLALAEDEGVLITRVVPEGPAAKSGLKDGDIITALAGQTVDGRTLGRRLQRIGAGETIPVQIVRDGQRTTLQLTLGERPKRP
jgi:serine protease Do